ncbi:MAG: class I SAM-dependent methyltransferase [Bacilli bacterium]|nr:class I SAM-dependent methyltransferase [Bacilli bacterium]
MSHYFTKNNNLKSDEYIINILFKEKKYSFYVDYGVFSKKGLDFGTRSLLESLDIEKINGNVLDFGCGYGPIGIIVSDNSNAQIDMLDINDRAIKLTKKNIELNRVKNINAFESDIFENVNKKYNFIITNPPIRVGKEILYKILFGAKEYLEKNGELWLVINKNQGAKSLLNDLSKEYNVEVVNKKKSFYIIRAINN